MPSAVPPPALSRGDGAGGAPTVIIVGAEPRKLVTIARSLHRAGVRCVIATPSGQPLRVSSRAFADVVRLRGDLTDSASALSRLARAEGAGWVVPTSDTSLQIVCAAYDELSRFCAVGTPPPAIVQRVLDKSITLSIAQQCGVPVPTSVTIPRAADLEAALATMRFPIIAKPGDKSRKSTHDFKTRTFDSAEELRAIFTTQTRFGEGLLFQSYHGGEGVGIELLLSKGEIVASFQHRRLSENPPSGGVAVVAIAEAVNPTLLDYSVRLLRALEWDGVAMVEFRHDSATGDTALMEVNGRFWGSLPLNTIAGIDFPLYAWQLSQGITPAPPPSYPIGLRVRWTAGALERAGHVFAELPDDRISLGSALRQLMADFAPGVKSATWSWSDPLPAIQEVATVLKRWIKDAVKAVLRAIIPRSLLSVMKDSRMLPADRRATYVKRRLQRMVGATRAVALPPRIESVIFVCHGNIMRSAAAAGFLRDDLRAAGITNVRVASAGTNAHDGRPADARAQDAARQLGLSLHDHAAARLTKAMVADNDVIFAMDELNFVNISTTFPEARPKLLLFGGMNAKGVYRAHEIADPYMTSASEVASTIALIKSYVAQLAQALRAHP
ncbi:MAG TPA: ATP-grasp domain-containing protein [Gemmatimonadaceae bacterium]|nr:ATP-grasp domain-containing protein [Gemmatimonadaceae bacterium]